MPELDGFAVLRAIGENPEAFGEIDGAVAKAARDLVVKRLKAKSLAVDDARAVREAVGHDMFDRIVDGMSAANLKSIVSQARQAPSRHEGIERAVAASASADAAGGGRGAGPEAGKIEQGRIADEDGRSCHRPRSAFAPRR